ncbi:MAG: 2-phospho-L-lactate guanylyltransferase [Novosphingobium sp.]
MSWTAVVPLKQGEDPKSRLSAILSPSDRIALSVHMARRVIEALRASASIDQILLFSPIAPPALMDVEWCADKGPGLNDGLDRLRRKLAERPVLVIHGDVPLAGAADIEAMVRGAGERGHSLAPDRHDAGTNAVALMPGQVLSFAFGRDSFARHRANAPHAALIRRPGLAIDVDTPEDLAIASAFGFLTPA